MRDLVPATASRCVISRPSARPCLGFARHANRREMTSLSAFKTIGIGASAIMWALIFGTTAIARTFGDYLTVATRSLLVIAIFWTLKTFRCGLGV